MMRELSMDPDRALPAGRDLSDAGSRLRHLRERSGAEVATMSAARPWGTDDIGQAFERNYRTVETEFLQAWETLGRHVEGLGDAVIEAVREAVQADENASVRALRTYGKRQ